MGMTTLCWFSGLLSNVDYARDPSSGVPLSKMGAAPLEGPTHPSVSAASQLLADHSGLAGVPESDLRLSPDVISDPVVPVTCEDASAADDGVSDSTGVLPGHGVPPKEEPHPK